MEVEREVKFSWLHDSGVVRQSHLFPSKSLAQLLAWCFSPTSHQCLLDAWPDVVIAHIQYTMTASMRLIEAVWLLIYVVHTLGHLYSTSSIGRSLLQVSFWGSASSMKVVTDIYIVQPRRRSDNKIPTLCLNLYCLFSFSPSFKIYFSKVFWADPGPVLLNVPLQISNADTCQSDWSVEFISKPVCRSPNL